MDQSELGVHGRRDTQREIVYAVVAFSLCLSQKVLTLMTMEGGRVSLGAGMHGVAFSQLCDCLAGSSSTTHCVDVGKPAPQPGRQV